MPTVSLFRPTVTRVSQDGANTIRRRTKTKKWWMKWKVAGRVWTEATGNADRSAAREIARARERSLTLGAFGIVDPAGEQRYLTWDQFESQYLENVRAVNRPQTANVYAASLAAFRRIVQPTLVRMLNVRMLQEFVVTRMREAGGATVNKDLRSIRAALRWGRARGCISGVPCFKELFVREDVKDPVVMTDAEIKAMLTAMDDPNVALPKRPAAWWRIFIRLLLYTGMRRSEALGLTWNRVDFTSGDVPVHRQTSKGRKDRVYPGAWHLVKALKEWFDAQEVAPARSDPVLPWPHGTLRQLYVEWHRIRQAAGIPDDRHYVPKHLRSTCATQLLDAGESTLVVKDWLGHSSVQVTERFYASTREARRKAAGRRRVV